ncbi:uncharacterized protein N7459_001307 [Penicillium hispanicum]|uniref:uncharacterized protein n=1 Tax=Penicillium hispanicum TaxID=1080232 RepID=UPI00253FA9D3|nr:uncharacterized protein N7459_001307 [Penicillium hispanicum]KAJ5595099.1 hypothetical protein N7459_001307 [Penicillium hispanicum]
MQPKTESPDSMFVPQQLPVQTTGSTSSSVDILTLDMKDLVKKIQNLSHLGIEDSNITLPKICVVGDQSTGKSSLIEGISGIKVPRSAGTCTRCPMEINICESEEGQGWKCVIYLSIRYCYEPHPGKRPKNVSRRPDALGPWKPMGSQEDEVFVTLTDKDKVQDAIRWAQLAILNPRTPSQDYVPGNNLGMSMEAEEKFSPNVVRLDISAPSFPALSFYDLPGVISQAEHDEEAYLVQLVENLVRKYVSQENCIILLTLTMTDDATNSSAARIIRDVKTAKERTLGVLTKPDKLSGDDSHTQWVEMLDGTKFQLGHGYFVVRNNSNPDIDHLQAREEEDLYFERPPWSSQMARHQDRFGVRKLQSALSDVLMAQIQKCLPSVIEQINEKAERIDTELNKLPDPPTENVQQILRDKLFKLGVRFNGIFTGGHGSNILQKDWNLLVTDFQKALKTTRPSLITISDSDTVLLAEKIDSDCEIILNPQTPTRLKRKAPIPDAQTSENVSKPVPRGPTYNTEHFEKWKGPGRRFTLEELHRIKQESHRVGMPNQIDPSATETLNRESVKHWEDILSAFAYALYGGVQKALFMTLDEVIAQYHQTGFYRELRHIVSSFLGQAHAELLVDATAYYRMEYVRPFTMAEAEHRQATAEALRTLVYARRRARAKCWLKLRNFCEDENIGKVSDSDLGPDQFSQELEMMANSRGYYEVASSRFLDVVCLFAESRLRLKCRDELINAIDIGLNAKSEDRCTALMAEDPEREARRISLTKEKEKLTRAQEWLNSVHQVDDDDEDEMYGSSEDTMEVSNFYNEDWGSCCN